MNIPFDITAGKGPIIHDPIRTLEVCGAQDPKNPVLLARSLTSAAHPPPVLPCLHRRLLYGMCALQCICTFAGVNTLTMNAPTAAQML